MSKFTPGPWRKEDGTTSIWGHCNPDDQSTYGMGYPIAKCRTNPSGNWSTGPYADEAEANARLIAASPDLYEAGKAQTAIIRRAQRLIDENLKPDGISDRAALDELRAILDGPDQRAAQAKWDAAVAKVEKEQ